MRLVAIGGSDADIQAALRARELDPSAEATVVLADAYPNYSICGIAYYVSGEVGDWHNLAHRTIADLEGADRIGAGQIAGALMLRSMDASAAPARAAGAG